MIATIKCPRGRRMTAAVTPVVWLLLVVGLATPALAFKDIENPVVDSGYNPNGIFVLDGTFVMNVGEVQINIDPDSIYTGALGASEFARRAVVEA